MSQFTLKGDGEAARKSRCTARPSLRGMSVPPLSDKTGPGSAQGQTLGIPRCEVSSCSHGIVASKRLCLQCAIKADRHQPSKYLTPIMSRPRTKVPRPIVCPSTAACRTSGSFLLYTSFAIASDGACWRSRLEKHIGAPDRHEQRRGAIPQHVGSGGSSPS